MFKESRNNIYISWWIVDKRIKIRKKKVGFWARKFDNQMLKTVILIGWR